MTNPVSTPAFSATVFRQTPASSGSGSTFRRVMMDVNGGTSATGVAISSAALAMAASAEATKTSSADLDLNLSTITAAFDRLIERKHADGAGDDYLARVNAARETYLDIVGRAEAEGGFANPQAFVASLSVDDLQALQHVQSLAFPIQPAGLSQEGALNLLLPSSMARDIDRNGITNVGLANMIAFPPYDAPADFREAWAQTTQNMDWATRSQMEADLWAHGPGQTAWSQGLTDTTASLSYGDIDYADLLDRTIASTRYNLDHQESITARDHVATILAALRALQSNMANSALQRTEMA